MTLEIVLNEDDLRKMPPDLRENLIKWYFDHGETKPITPKPPVSMPPQRVDSERVSFFDFVQSGILAPGAELKCKALKRQRRNGANPYFDAGKVLEDGSVEYEGKHYFVPSKLAVAVVNANGGETKALNGYDYLYVRISNRLVPLQDLRERFLKQHDNS